jgi:hypothetical protein
MFDLNALLVGSIPLIAIVFGLVEFIKSLGLTGRILAIVSMAIGLVLGLCYHVATIAIPVGFAGWFTAVIFGLAIGLVASGFYDFADARWPIKTPPA